MSVVDRERFVAERQGRWKRLDSLVTHAPTTAAEWSELAEGYRSLCADLARARAAGLPSDVSAYLDQLAGRAHNRLYSMRERGFGRSLFRDALVGFPRELRANFGFFVLATVLFYAPFALGAVGAYEDLTFAQQLLSPDQLEALEQTWAQAPGRTSSQDAQMAGFYVLNNVGIAFRVFALGVVYGVGTLFYLVYNGLVIGATFGYVFSVGHGGNLLMFVSGHSAWELTGICVAGAAGLRMGWALAFTDGKTRWASLREAGPGLYRLVLGTALMILVAAAIEGFWSGTPMPVPAKVAFGVAQAVIVAGWLGLGGR